MSAVATVPQDHPPTIPEHPHGAALTRRTWQLVTARWLGDQPPIGELSFWSQDLWRGGSEIVVSRIGPVLAVEYTDVPGQATLVASPGAPLDRRTRRRLAAFVGTHDVRFLTEPTATALRGPLEAAGYALAQERDNADYLYRLKDHAGYRGPGLRGKLRQVRRFTNRTPSHAFRHGTLDESWAHRTVLEVGERWLAAKHPAGAPAAVERELAGARAWRRGPGAEKVHVFCLDVGGAPVAVSVVEPLWNDTFLGLFFKADPTVPYAAAALRMHVAGALERLAPEGRTNAMQDDGIPALRASKLSYHPIRLEPKFAVVPITPSTPAIR